MHVPWPPRRVLALAVALVAGVGVLAAAVGWGVGRAAAVGVLLGALGVSTAAVAAVPVRVRGLVAALGAASFGLGWLAHGHALAAGAAVAVAALAQVPPTRHGARTATFLPVLAALGAALPLGSAGPAVTGWVAVGGLVVVALTTLARVAVPAQPVPAAEAGRHAVATALVAGAGTVVTTALGLGHGYWLVVAVAMVLAVSREETSAQATARVVGTVTGVLAAVLAVAVLPTVVALTASALLGVLALAWTAVRETRWMSAASSAAVVLVGSGGLFGSGAGLALERLLLTGAGAALAALVAAGLWRVERSSRADAPA
ncbi:hypothetical protein G7075_03130 [Phycicoccus sp. HDW14]|uniref:FUSC family protein n=1 Tax=Phycicoccus sp. HDW14 TaxID=2714941 RepID=UPI0014092475|nr:FUSC family protein [Phycicoccus sp. HDW14]QIM20371.1 hypothetical protein G7075_03130 [Phycicoccus sp. HDW14]